MLAQIERGEGNPTLSTLWKIANGMQVSFNTLIAQPKLPYKVTKLAEIEPILDMNGGLKIILYFLILKIILVFTK